MTAVSRFTSLSFLITLSLAITQGIAQGQSGSEPADVSPEARQHIEKVTSCLESPVVIKGAPRACRTLTERMNELHVPGVSVAVIHNGSIEWARGFGAKQKGGPPVRTDTLFQAGSISKPVAAMAALRLVQEGKLSLDAPVNEKLVSWKLPESPASNGKPVTLRELLTHTAGLTVHGFPGYAADAPLPTLVQILDGVNPANTAPIRVENEPATQWKYSGGGYTVMQQMLVDLTKQPFPKLLRDTVLAPLGMAHSTYQQPLPAELKPAAAVPYQRSGEVVPGGAHTYPEMAAAGLWTTPSDLALYCMELQRSLVGKANHVLSQDQTRQMLTAGKGHWGLGLSIGGSTNDPYFSHGGVDAGFESLLVAYENHGDGAIVMTNAEGGTSVANEVMQSISAEYGWADFHPTARAAVQVDRAVLERYVGTYQLAPDFSVAIRLDGNQLQGQGTGQSVFKMFAESQKKFFLTDENAQIEFFADGKDDDKDKVAYMILYQGGQQMKGVKK